MADTADSPTDTAAAPETEGPPQAPVLLGAAMILLAMNLRPAVAAVGPLIHRIRADTGLSSVGAGLLTALPVLCFGAMAPLASVAARRLGTTRTFMGVLVTLVAGLLVRLVPGLGFLFLGTALAGAAIAAGNVLLPVLVRRNFAQRTGLITGLYTIALTGTSALAAALAVPAANALGGGWRGGLGIWALPALIALGVWLVELRHRGPQLQAPGERMASARSLLHDRIAWSLMLFFGIQSSGFYATLAWLPSIFQSHGASEAEAGVLLGVSMVVGIGTALTVPALAARTDDQRRLLIRFIACAALGWVGILAAPMSAPYVWVVLLGVGQNALFPLALTLIVLRGGTVTSTAGLSSLVQTGGYLIAAFAPLGIGALHRRHRFLERTDAGAPGAAGPAGRDRPDRRTAGSRQAAGCRADARRGRLATAGPRRPAAYASRRTIRTAATTIDATA